MCIIIKVPEGIDTPPILSPPRDKSDTDEEEEEEDFFADDESEVELSGKNFYLI